MFASIFILECPLTIIVNLLLIISMSATKKSMKNTSNFLIVCLCTSDAMIGAFVMPIHVIESFWVDPKGFCSFITTSTAFQSFLTNVSMLMTMLLAVDRYLHMNPEYHRSPPRLAKLFERPRIFIMIGVLSLLSAVIALGSYFAMSFDLKIVTTFNIWYGVFFTIIAVIFTVLYIRGYLRIRRHVAENPVYTDRGANESPEYLNELLKTVLLLLTAMLVSWLPGIVLNLALAFWSSTHDDYDTDVKHVDSNLYFVFSSAAHALFFLNNAASALIILYRNEKSKKWLVELYSSYFQQRSQEEVENNVVVVLSPDVASNR